MTVQCYEGNFFIAALSIAIGQNYFDRSSLVKVAPLSFWSSTSEELIWFWVKKEDSV